MPINKAKCYLKVSEKRTYGKSYYTPECEISSVILAMMGKEYGDRVAFTRQDIDFLRDFGCDVQIQGENK